MYHKVWETASDVIQSDPARAREVFATLYQSPMFKNTVSAVDIASSSEGGYQTYLDYVDSELNGKEPPYTFEEHIFRAHFAGSALIIFNEYIMGWGLMSCPDVRGRIYGRVNRLLNEYYVATGKIQISGSSNLGTGSSASQSQGGTRRDTQSPSSAPRQRTPITAQMATEWLSNPTHSDIGKFYFIYNATEESRTAKDKLEPSTWRLTGISLQENEVLYNVEMTFTEGRCDIPYDTEALKDLLMDSEIDRVIPRPQGADAGGSDTFGFLRSAV